jgi:hypothetical protein
MEITLKIVAIQVLLTAYADRVSFKTEIPNELEPADGVWLDTTVGKDQGIDWVRTRFGVEPEVINVRCV